MPGSSPHFRAGNIPDDGGMGVGVADNDQAEALKAAEHWDDLAEEQQREAAYLKDRNRYSGAHLFRAELYRRCAESLRLEAANNRPYCVCHLESSCPTKSVIKLRTL
jgi:hypothetical protein